MSSRREPLATPTETRTRIEADEDAVWAAAAERDRCRPRPQPPRDVRLIQIDRGSGADVWLTFRRGGAVDAAG